MFFSQLLFYILGVVRVHDHPYVLMKWCYPNNNIVNRTSFVIDLSVNEHEVLITHPMLILPRSLQ